MKARLVLIGTALVAATLSGCGKKSADVGSAQPAVSNTIPRLCTEIANVTDPEELAAMKDRCAQAASAQFRSGTYQPSSGQGF